MEAVDCHRAEAFPRCNHLHGCHQSTATRRLLVPNVRQYAKGFTATQKIRTDQEILVKELMGTKVPRKLGVRRAYVKKTGRFVFYARTKDLEWARAVDAARSNADGRHKLVTMVKKRRCIVCRFEFKKTKCGRQAPKLAKYECTGYQPATALCAPEGGECWGKWHSGGAEGSA